MRKLLPFTAFTLIFALVFMLGACDDNNYINPDTSISWPPSAIPLTESIWADGYLANSNAKQWFSFTATAGADTQQYIHFDTDALSIAYMQLYDSTGAPIGSRGYLYISTVSASYLYISQPVTPGNNYYVLITSDSRSSRNSGAYRIAFNKSAASPRTILPTTDITTLNVNTWTNGSIATGGEQWFKFTATADTHYIHFEPGTLNGLNIQLYNNTGVVVGYKAGLYSTARYISRAVTSGNEYYIKATPYSNGGNGAYRIAFNTYNGPPSISLPAPSADITTLAETDKWYDGVIPTASGVQWFKFTATADIQFIHFKPDTLKDVYVQLCDTTDGRTVGGRTNLYDRSISTPRTVESGHEYYIRITPYSGSGAYSIAFNTTPSAPDANVINLTDANKWYDGSLADYYEIQWFVFTATAAKQYVHFKAGTLKEASVQIYDNAGITIGGWSYFYLYGDNLSTSLPVSNGDVYYIKATTINTSASGDFKMGFSASGAEPTD